MKHVFIGGPFDGMAKEPFNSMYHEYIDMPPRKVGEPFNETATYTKRFYEAHEYCVEAPSGVAVYVKVFIESRMDWQSRSVIDRVRGCLHPYALKRDPEKPMNETPHDIFAGIL